MGKNLTFPVRAFEALPSTLSLSSYTDFLLLLGGLKPTLRLHVPESRTREELDSWCARYGYASVSNGSGYVCVAGDVREALRVQELDDSREPHEYQLGVLLGYPQCCCKRAAAVGETNLDGWENGMAQQSTFTGQFELIDPHGYSDGYSLISHIPCCAKCKPSLRVAKAALRLVSYHRESPHFRRWLRWTEMPLARRYGGNLLRRYQLS